MRTSYLQFVFIAGLLLSAFVQAQTLFVESFEEPDFTIGDQLGTVAGWTGNDSGTDIDVSISGTQASSGTQSVFLSDNSATTRAQLVYDFGQNVTNGYVDFDIRPGSSATAYYVYFYDQGTYDTNFFLAISSQFTLGITGGTAKTAAFSGTGYSYDPDASAWSTFRVGFDESTKSAYVTVDGNTIGGLTVNSGYSDSTNWQAGRIAVIVGSNASTGVSANFDMISATAVPEPSTFALMAGVCGLLFVFVRRYKA